MYKIDVKYQLSIPAKLIEIAETDFTNNVRIYLKGNTLFFDNPSPSNFKLPCLGPIALGKSRRFILPKMVRTIFNFAPGDQILFYISEGKIAFKRILEKEIPNH